MAHSKIRWLLIVMVLFGATVFFTTVSFQPPPKPIVPLTNTPSFSVELLDGSVLTFESLSGRVVLLHFWASWCVPCHEEFPKLLELAGSMGDNVWLLAISADEHPEKARAFIDNLHQRYPHSFSSQNIIFAFDQDKHISKDLFQIVRYPETIIFDSQLQPQRKITNGLQIWDTTEIQESLITFGKTPVRGYLESKEIESR